MMVYACNLSLQEAEAGGDESGWVFNFLKVFNFLPRAMENFWEKWEERVQKRVWLSSCLKAKMSEFKVLLSYIASLRAAWTLKVLTQKQNNKTPNDK